MNKHEENRITSYQSEMVIKELFDLQKEDMLTIAIIDWWLMKHEKTYKNLKDSIDRFQDKEFQLIESGEYKKYVAKKLLEKGFEAEELIGKRIVDFEHLLGNSTEQQVRLIRIYETMESLSNLHKKEPEFEQLLSDLKTIDKDAGSLEKWADEHVDDCLSSVFLICDYLPENVTPNAVKVFYKEETYIKIELRAFKNIITLASVFGKYNEVLNPGLQLSYDKLNELNL